MVQKRRKYVKKSHKMSDREAKCPFFQRHDRISVQCEGPIFDTLARVTFESGEKKAQHFSLYCRGNFEMCEMYRSVYREKYEGTEDE